MNEITPSPDVIADLEPEFQIIRPLGEGAAARVLLARETELRRLVAIKIPRREIVEDEIARRRFEREAMSVARLTHPNIASIFRVGHLRDGTPYLVMRYAEGRTLSDVLRSEWVLAESEACTILLQVASALSEAHGKGIVHRDVRPDNVIWTRESGQAVLMDFGLAAILDSGNTAQVRLTQTGQRLGDMGHMSPEQIRGEPVTPAADIYSLGVLGYEMLTGEGPYPGTSKVQLPAAHLNQAPHPLTTQSPDVARLLEACLAKNPAHRPTAADVVRRLSQGTTRQTGASPPTGRQIPALAAFMDELKRRRVVNVALLYAGAAFVLLQAAELILDSLPLPDWSYDALVALVLAGFPVALVLTWVFEITGGRVLRTTAAPDLPPRVRRTHLLLQAVGMVASLLLAWLIGWWVLAA